MIITSKYGTFAFGKPRPTLPPDLDVMAKRQTPCRHHNPVVLLHSRIQTLAIRNGYKVEVATGIPLAKMIMTRTRLMIRFATTLTLAALQRSGKATQLQRYYDHEVLERLEHQLSGHPAPAPGLPTQPTGQLNVASSPNSPENVGSSQVQVRQVVAGPTPVSPDAMDVEHGEGGGGSSSDAIQSTHLLLPLPLPPPLPPPSPRPLSADVELAANADRGAGLAQPSPSRGEIAPAAVPIIVSTDLQSLGQPATVPEGSYGVDTAQTQDAPASFDVSVEGRTTATGYVLANRPRRPAHATATSALPPIPTRRGSPEYVPENDNLMFSEDSDANGDIDLVANAEQDDNDDALDTDHDHDMLNDENQRQHRSDSNATVATAPRNPGTGEHVALAGHLNVHIHNHERNRQFDQLIRTHLRGAFEGTSRGY
ncbi:hypothetical protein H1R20_g9514, partial [Candolleomyces eurysporus]